MTITTITTTTSDRSERLLVGRMDWKAFRADIVVCIDDVYQKKVAMLDAHVSQFYEWLPWTVGQLDDVPKDPVARRTWLATRPSAVGSIKPEWRDVLERLSGPEAQRIQHAEAFEITEYGRTPSEEEIRKLFPFFPTK